MPPLQAQLTLTQFIGDTQFGFITRIFGTFFGAIVGLLIWCAPYCKATVAELSASSAGTSATAPAMAIHTVSSQPAP